MVPPNDVPAGDLVPSPEPRHGGLIRFLSADPQIGGAVLRANIAEGVRPGGLLLGWRRPRTGSPCWILELRPGARFPDGASVTASEVARYWVDAAARSADDAAWLLEPFLGDDAASGGPSIASALHASGNELEACPRRPTPDLPERIEHPALWLVRGDGNGPMNGPGPFFQAPDGTLWPNPGFVGPGPYVDHVEPMAVEGDPTVPLRLGDAHVAVVYGKTVSELQRDPGPSAMKLDRLPGWSRTYYLWMNPTKRWVNDPYFRNWISSLIDRDEIVSYLFGGQGERAFLLSAGAPAAEVPLYDPLHPQRPVSATTVPRLELLYDASDIHAETLARRIQAVLESHAVTLSLAARPTEELRGRLRRGDAEMALLAHRPAADDPLLALLGSVWWLGPSAAQERDELIRASSEIDPAERERRREAAWEVEARLLESARVVPLIRLDAWIARHPSLAGLVAGPEGVLRLDDAWWLP